MTSKQITKCRDYLEANHFYIDAHELIVESEVVNGRVSTQYFFFSCNDYYLPERLPKAFITYITNHIPSKTGRGGITRYRVGFRQIRKVYADFYDVAMRQLKLKALIS